MGWGSFIGGMLTQGFIDKLFLESEKKKAIEDYQEKQDIITLKQEIERLKNQLNNR